MNFVVSKNNKIYVVLLLQFFVGTHSCSVKLVLIYSSIHQYLYGLRYRRVQSLMLCDVLGDVRCFVLPWVLRCVQRFVLRLTLCWVLRFISIHAPRCDKHVLVCACLAATCTSSSVRPVHNFISQNRRPPLFRKANKISIPSEPMKLNTYIEMLYDH